jgi:hypothetical protein
VAGQRGGRSGGQQTRANDLGGAQQRETVVCRPLANGLTNIAQQIKTSSQTSR